MGNNYYLKVILFLAFCNQALAVEDCKNGEQSETNYLVKTEHTLVYSEPKLCKPKLVSGFDVEKGYKSTIYSLNWSKQYHDLWYVDSYDVRVNEDEILNFDTDVSLPLSLNRFSLVAGNLDSFEVRACSSIASENNGPPLVACGEWQETFTHCEIECTDSSLPVTELTAPNGINVTGDYAVNWVGVTWMIDLFPPTFRNFSSYELQQSVDGVWSTLQNDTNLNISMINQSNGVYSYRVRGCVEGNVCGGYSGVKEVAVDLQRPTLKTPSSTNTTGDYSVSWSEVKYDDHVERYLFQESSDGGATWVIISNDRRFSYDFINQSNGVNYKYRVRACRANNNCSYFSPEQQVSVQLEVPVFGALASPNTTGSYEISWSAVAYDSSVVRYKLKEKINEDPWTTVSNDLRYSYQFNNQTNGNTYTYLIKACRVDNNCSDFSPEKVVAVIIRPQVPNLTVPLGINTTGVFDVLWTAQSYATNYEIQQRVDNGQFETIQNDSQTSVTINDGQHNKTYYYQVRACNTNVCSAYSPADWVTVVFPTPSVPLLTVPNGTNTTGNYDVTWNASENFTTYYEFSESVNNGFIWNTQTTDADVLSYSYLNKASGTYQYRIKACTALLCSDFSSVAVVTVSRPVNTVTESMAPFIPNGTSTLEWSDLPSAPLSSTLVGQTNSQFNVAQSGSAGYSIGIMTAPASGGFAPNVSINYSSQSSRGAMGQGWGVSGYSSIARCSQTFAQDSDGGSLALQVRAVTFTESDRFCVNGQRLMLVTDADANGTDDGIYQYGDNNAQYRTEIDSFTKYISKGTAGSGPQCFEAWHKDGSKTYYGDCSMGPNALVSANISSGSAMGSALMWAQSRMMDNRGNYYDNHYLSSNSGSVEFFLDRIEYTANINVAGSALNGVIQLDYADMSANDITSSVISNYPFVKSLNNSKKLTGVSSKYNNQSLRYYKFQYNQDDAAGMSLLTSIQECASQTSSACYKPTDIYWGNTETGVMGSSSGALPISSQLPPVVPNEQMVVGQFDANGDGYEDFYYLANDVIKVGLSNGNSFDVIDGPVIPSGINSNIGIKVADVNADGFPDFIYLGKVYLWTGVNSNYEAVDLLIDDAQARSQLFYDFDGDGLVDVLNFIDSSPEPVMKVYANRYDLTQDNSSSDHQDLIDAFDRDNPLVIDFNLKDFYTNSTDVFRTGSIRTDGVLIDQVEVSQVTDINADGIPELMLDVEMTLLCTGQYCPDIGHIEFTKLKAIAYLTETNGMKSYQVQHIAGDAACTVCVEQISHEQFVDVTADGKPEFCYLDLFTTLSPLISNVNSWKCHSELGDENTTSLLELNTLHDEYPGFSLLNEIGFIDYQDIDGDGYLDFMYSDDDSFDPNNSWKWKKVSWNDGNIVLASSWTDLPVKAGNADSGTPGPGDSPQYVDANLFFDINNDGMTDHMIFEVQNDTSVNFHRAWGATNAASADKGKVTDITAGFDENWQIVYKPMFDPSVYTRATDSIGRWSSNGRSPVYDFNSGMPLVASTKHSMPAWINTSASLAGTTIQDTASVNETKYHYGNAKLEAGGRGFVGFAEFAVTDLENGILSQTVLKQNFPFIGAVESVTVSSIGAGSNKNSLVPEYDTSVPCWVYQECDLAKSNKSAVSKAAGVTMISYTSNQWLMNDIVETGARSVFPYLSSLDAKSYELSDGLQTGRKVSDYFYQEAPNSFYGNLTGSTEKTYQGNNGLIQTVTLANEYNYYTGDWVFDRVKNSSVTHSRAGVTSELREVSFTYDGDRLLKSETQSASGGFNTKTIDSRDAYNNVAQIRLSGSNSLTTQSKVIYDSAGRYVLETQNHIAGSFKTTDRIIQVNKFGLAEIAENTQGVRSYSRYDDMGRLFYNTNELGEWSQVSFTDGVGNCPAGTAFYKQLTSAGPSVTTCFDILGRANRTITQGFASGELIYVDSHYDKSGRANESSVPSFAAPNAGVADHWNRNAYDELGRVQLTRESGDARTYQSYAYSSALEKSELMLTNALNHSTYSYSNALGEVTQVTDANGDSISYGYDGRGNRVLVDGPLSGDDIISTYDNYDNVTRIDDPDLGIWNYNYNAYGQLLYQIDAKNNCTEILYDELGRTTDKFFYKNANADCTGGVEEDHSEYTYDLSAGSASFGLLLAEQNRRITKSYLYDGYGRLDETISYTPETFMTYNEFSYYDQYSRPWVNYDASGDGLKYQYNGFGYFQSSHNMAANDVSVLQTILAMDAFGNIKQERSGNGVYTNRLYDLRGRINSIKTGSTINGSDIQYLTYSHDDVGNLLVRNDNRIGTNTMSEIFGYDQVNRLETVDLTVNGSTSRVYDIQYDAGGRRDWVNGFNYSYNDPSHVHGVTSTSDGKSYVYDAVGNQTSSDGKTLVYTAFNKVRNMKKNGFKVKYTYGPNMHKVKRRDTNTSTGEDKRTWYIGNVEVITDRGTSENKRYVGNSIITLSNSASPTIDYVHKDHLGSMQTITQKTFSAGSTQHLSYDAFGKRRNAANWTDLWGGFNPIDGITDKGFTNQEHIDELDLVDFNARIYDPNLGMMLQADTIVPNGPAIESLNRYAYVFNNPLSYTDPSGHVPKDGKPNEISEGFGGLENAMQVFGPHPTTDQSMTLGQFINNVIQNEIKSLVKGVENKSFAGLSEAESIGKVQEIKLSDGKMRVPNSREYNSKFYREDKEVKLSKHQIQAMTLEQGEYSEQDIRGRMFKENATAMSDSEYHKYLGNAFSVLARRFNSDSSISNNIVGLGVFENDGEISTSFPSHLTYLEKTFQWTENNGLVGSQSSIYGESGNGLIGIIFRGDGYDQVMSTRSKKFQQMSNKTGVPVIFYDKKPALNRSSLNETGSKYLWLPHQELNFKQAENQ